jgi:putative hemolysin
MIVSQVKEYLVWSADSLTQEPLAAPQSPERLVLEIQQLPSSQRLVQSGPYVAYIAAAQQIPSLLQELGRLRELTFRLAGEGTGSSSDLDRFDAHYLHLFLWNADRSEVVGAYRVGCTDTILPRFGAKGLYTSTLFTYHPLLLQRLSCALELGRSFIRPEYQRTFNSLFLLWKGIARFVAQQPHYRLLFGAVSISNAYTRRSRELLVRFLRATTLDPALANLVEAKHPPCFPSADAWDDAGNSPLLSRNLEAVELQLATLESGQRGIPILIRQYLKLGGQILGFNQDALFSDVIDGLILVDLAKTEPKMLSHYMGKTEASAFLARHQHCERALLPSQPRGRLEPQERVL